ncbi:acyl-CoA carboxylase subunit epsilon [Dactylosporangium sp. NPDC048998]|uniref:acyl-CoA carboxylase subunit epsilon n=1 Tax=Dactylosporangium sp. NPDC048998 TaxID=3363976 RepID=UPI00371ADCE9
MAKIATAKAVDINAHTRPNRTFVNAPPKFAIDSRSVRVCAGGCAYARRTATFREHVREGSVTGEPLFKVVRGTPTAEEVAAIVGALFSLAPATPPAGSLPGERPRSRWMQSARPGRRRQWGAFAGS